MGTPLMTAFAFGRLARVNVFHHSPGNSVTLEHPFRFYRVPPPQNRGEPSAIRSILRRARLTTCFDHYGLIMVTGTPSRAETSQPKPTQTDPVTPKRQPEARLTDVHTHQ